MSDESVSASPATPADVAGRRLAKANGAAGAGIALAVVGVILGLAMALERRETPCPDGTYFPEGAADYRCFVHPQALDGSAIVVISAMLGILIGMVGVLVKEILRGVPADGPR